MGNGIAHVFAQSGFNVTLIDVQDAALERALSTIGRNLDRLIKRKDLRSGQRGHLGPHPHQHRHG